MRRGGARPGRCGHAAARDASSSGRCPSSSAIRLDADTAARPGALREAIERFRAADRAVLIGTQMVAKGHHFPGVDLAAVIDADTGLALPDFRAEERTFQLVTQLAGRSGRDAPGLVLVQTYQPEAMPLQFAQRHDVAGFLAEELERRAALGYPPLRHLVAIVVSGPDAGAADRVLREVREVSRASKPTCSDRLRSCACEAGIEPSSSPRRRSRAALARRAAGLLAAAGPAMRRAGMSAVVDVDPQSL